MYEGDRRDWFTSIPEIPKDFDYVPTLIAVFGVYVLYKYWRQNKNSKDRENNERRVWRARKRFEKNQPPLVDDTNYKRLGDIKITP